MCSIDRVRLLAVVDVDMDVRLASRRATTAHDKGPNMVPTDALTGISATILCGLSIFALLLVIFGVGIDNGADDAVTHYVSAVE